MTIQKVMTNLTTHYIEYETPKSIKKNIENLRCRNIGDEMNEMVNK